MLRTSMSTAGARGAMQFFAPSRAGLRFQPLPHLRAPQRITQRTFTQRPTVTQRPSTSFTFSSNSRPTPANFLQRLRASLRFFHSSRARRDAKAPPNSAPEPEPTSLRARMRKLSREYGWVALGVYLGLSTLDFPFCYLLVRYVGTDKIGEWEHKMVTNAKKFIPESVQQTWHDWRASMKKAEHDATGSEEINDAVEMAGWGVEKAEKEHKAEASLATQLALAYAIHKSFIFIRVPLTAAVTPKVVKVLRGWGWNIGKRTTKEGRAINRAANASKKP